MQLLPPPTTAAAADTATATDPASWYMYVTIMFYNATMYISYKYKLREYVVWAGSTSSFRVHLLANIQIMVIGT